MTIAVRQKDENGDAVKDLLGMLESYRLSHTLVQSLKGLGEQVFELAVVIGGDREILIAHQELGVSNLPILGVNESEQHTFLTEISLRELPEAVRHLKNRNYLLEDATRISVTVDGRSLPPALNEVAVFSHRSATLMEYTLTVDGEMIWRDYGDGVIISTPTGSSAYALSAGGPMVLQNAHVFSVVPVNSLDITRRPLIVPNDSQIVIDEINSRHRCEVIVDGIHRAKVSGEVRAKKSSSPARLLRFHGISRARERIVKKVYLAEELLKVPPSAKLVLKTLQYEGPLSQKAIVKKTMLPDRTARQALSVLLGKGLIKAKPLLRDARQKVYYLT